MPTEKQLRNTFFKLMIGLVVIVIVMNFYSNTMPIIVESGNQINRTEAPLASFFAGDSTVMIIIMITLLLLLIGNILKGNRKF